MMAVPCEMLLYPELLSNEQLMCIIQERHLRVDNIERMSREDLIELFRNYCVPYGQRKYRDTGRGKVLNKTRHFSPEPAPKLVAVNFNISSRELKRERLKPPPEALNCQTKRIKLDNNLNTFTVNINKRKIPIDSPEAPMDISPQKKERVLITWP